MSEAAKAPTWEEGLLGFYADLVGRGWAAFDRSDASSHWWESSEAEEWVAGWRGWVEDRAAGDGLRLELRVLFDDNPLNYEFSFWTGAARLLGPGGEVLEQLPFTRHSQGHYHFVARDPEADVRLERALATVYGPTLAAARSRVAAELGASTEAERATS